ncbi:MAG: methyltransferase domain-containing protein [Bdellovibrionota bacterium]
MTDTTTTETPLNGEDFGEPYIKALMEQTADGVFLEDQVLTPKLQRYLCPLRGKRGVDLGCGYGMNTRRIRLLDCPDSGADSCNEVEMIGIDHSEEMLRHATKLTDPALGIEYLMMSAAQLRFPDQSFDFATSAFVLENMPDQVVRDGFHEAFRVLKPGGRFVVAMVHPTWFLMVSGRKDIDPLERYRRYGKLHVVITEQTADHTYTRNYRPLEWYINKAVDAGFALHRIKDLAIPDVPELPAKYHAKRGFPVFCLMVLDRK